jgi:hypothetical protein
MQTDEWMAYSCSARFSDQVSCITLCTSANGLRDMIFARFAKRKGKHAGMVWDGPDMPWARSGLMLHRNGLGLSRVGGEKLLNAQQWAAQGKIWDEAHLQIWQKSEQKAGLNCSGQI